MLTFGWGEILLIVGIIIIVVGPKDLPKLIKQFSSFTRSIKKLSREFKTSLNDIVDHDDFKEVKTSINEVNKIKEDHNRFYILTGAFSEYERGSNFCLLPHKSAHYFPDLIQSADGIVGKVGYGTVAEVWAAQKPFIAVFRENFRESQPMRNFINQNISGFEIGDQKIKFGLKRVKS